MLCEIPKGQAPGEAGKFLPASRRAALRAAQEALATGPVLITGAAGSGKTWLAGKLAAGPGPADGWLRVDLGPALDPTGLQLAIGHELGLDASNTNRPAIADALTEIAADGRRLGLMLDEAHLAPVETLQEALVLANHLGRPDGFAALVLVGQTSLLRRLELRALAALDSRLEARVHLRPLDADEAGEWLGRMGLDRAAADALHRASGGNPRLLLRLAAAFPSRTAPVARADEPLAVPPEMARLGTSRPPLLEEAGVVEVGWDAEAEPEAEAEAVEEEAAMAPTRSTGPEGVEDHYAALQAWDEWTRNQGRTSEVEPAAPAPATAPANVRFETQQGFAPYSQLFSRLKQSEDTGA